jgi:hypothetical protein
VFLQQSLEVVKLLLILIMEKFLLKIVFIFFVFGNLFKGLFANCTTSASAVFFDTSNSTSSNGHKIINCSFENLRGTIVHPGSIGCHDPIAKYNVTLCFFRNISNTNSSAWGGAFHCNMNNNNNFGYYNVTGNTFIEIRTNKSAVQLNGTFSSLVFSYNSFYNVSSVLQGGVLKLSNIYIYFLIFRQFG